MTEKMMRVTLIEPEQLVIDETDKPRPGRGEILIRVLRCGVCGSDSTIFHGRHPYAKKPVVMGHEFSGTIEALGEGVSTPAISTRVTVIPHLVCGECKPCRSKIYNFCEQLRCMGAEADGAHVNFINVPAEMALPIPETMSLDDAAMVEPACVAYHGARRGDITPTDKVLVIGAGPIGNLAMQSCRVLGAKEAYIADVDEWRLSLAMKSGATGAINLKKESLEEGLHRLAGGSKEIDVFCDCVGGRGQVFDQILSVAKRGARVVIIGVLQNEYIVPHLPDFVQHELRLSGTTMYVPQDYHDMIRFMGEGKIKTDGMITHCFGLSQIKDVFKLVDSRNEPFFKIMLTVGEEKGR